MSRYLFKDGKLTGNVKEYTIKSNNYISNAKAELVLTDSFHAIIFSINLNTNFFAFDRKMSNKKLHKFLITQGHLR